MRFHAFPFLMLVVSVATAGCGGAATNIGVAPDGGAGAATDGATGAAADGATVANGGSSDDAGPGGTPQTVPCGSATCAIPGQSCCVIANASPPPDFSFACVTGATCPQPAATDSGSVGHVASLQCTGAANCAGGEVCCMYEQTSPKQVDSRCMASCGGPGQAQLCDPNAPPSQSGCPASAPCSSTNIGDWDIPPGFATCGGVGS